MGIVTEGDTKVTGPKPTVTMGVIVVMPLGCTISCETGVPLMVTPLASILICASMPPGPTLSVMLCLVHLDLRERRRVRTAQRSA